MILLPGDRQPPALLGRVVLYACSSEVGGSLRPVPFLLCTVGALEERTRQVHPGLVEAHRHEDGGREQGAGRDRHPGQQRAMARGELLEQLPGAILVRPDSTSGEICGDLLRERLGIGVPLARFPASARSAIAASSGGASGTSVRIAWEVARAARSPGCGPTWRR